MLLKPVLPLYLLILCLDLALPAATASSTVSQDVHASLKRHTKNFVRDLRVAFGAVLRRRDNDLSPRTQVVFCKSSGPSGVTGNNTTSSGGDDGSGSDGGDNGSNGGDNGSDGGDSTTGSISESTLSFSSPSPGPTQLPSSGGGSGGGGGSTSPGGGGGSTSSQTSPWMLKQSYSGSSFFNGWSFLTGPDSTTHGVVNYVDQQTAQNSGLLEINSAGHAVMRVETTPTVTGNRMSIQISTSFSFNGGLILMDAVHMPEGCGTWPAFWTDGPNWPAGGEIDIIEGVNDYTNNQATLHTNPGCNLPSNNPSSLGITGTLVTGTDCAAADTGNAGCGIRSTSGVSFGSGFNGNGGGVYAMQWDDTGIAVYFFPRTSIPSDITAGTPLPSNWGQPMARWPASTCNPFQFFSQNTAIFDTTLCGDWAGADAVWGTAGVAGQTTSCASSTGFSTCAAYVQANGAAFANAYWEISYLKIYQTS